MLTSTFPFQPHCLPLPHCQAPDSLPISQPPFLGLLPLLQMAWPCLPHCPLHFFPIFFAEAFAPVPQSTKLLYSTPHSKTTLWPPSNVQF